MSEETETVEPTTFAKGRGRIIRIEVENFKSYAGRKVIGPFKNFTCIIGPNGSGKSNIMDAISFVMGLRASVLRSETMKNLIYNADLTQEEAKASQRSAYVRLFFQPYNEEGDELDEMEFLRSIAPSGATEYRIDGDVVSAQAYEAKLKEYGILVKAKNFLVFQGDVDAIAAKSPTELTKLLEQVSGSIEYKKEYERLKEDLAKAATAVVNNVQKKKGITAEKNKVKLQQREAEKYEKLDKERSKLKTEQMLFKLYHIENKIKAYIADHTRLKREKDDLDRKQQKLDAELKEKKAQGDRLRREVISKQGAAKEQAKSYQQLKEDQEKDKVQIAHLQKTIAERQRSTERSTQQASKREKTIKRLQKELDELTTQEKKFETEMKAREMRGLEGLSEEDRAEYYRLKNQASAQTITQKQERAKTQADLENLKQIENQIKSKITRLETQKQSVERAVQQLESRIEKISEEILSKLESDYNQKKAALTKVQERLSKRKTDKDEVERKLYEIREKLNDARVEKSENQNEQKFREAVESMKRLFPGVYGRVIDLCKISREKYNVPITVALGKNINSIVTDKEKTALECIDYLKEQRIALATFIPLDTIKAKKVNEKLRQDLSSETSRSKLAIDVITFDPAYDKAFRYSLGNAVVCDTLKDAMDLCFGGGSSEKGIKAVTVDGSVVNKNGLMTGGLADVQNKAKAITSKQPTVDITALKQKRDKFVQDLQDTIRDEAAGTSEQQKLEGEISTLESKIKMTRIDFDASEKKLRNARQELDELNTQLEARETGRPKLEEVRRQVDSLQEQLDELNSRIVETENRVFAAFAKRVGIANIREYEEEKLKMEQEAAQKRAEFGIVRTRLETDLEYETKSGSLGGATSAETARTELERDKEKLAALEKSAKDREKKITDFEKKNKDIVQQVKESKGLVDDKDIEIAEVKRLADENQQEVLRHQKHITAKETQLVQLRTKRFEIYSRCQVEEIDIPTITESELTSEEGGSASKKKRRRTSPSKKEAEEQYINYSEPFDPSATAQAEAVTASSSQSQTQTPTKSRSREEMICFNFTNLPAKVKALTEDEEIKKQEAEYEERITGLNNEIEQIAPTLKGIEKLGEVSKKLEETDQEYREAKDKQKELQSKFDKVKEKRRDLFMKTYEPISLYLPQIYLELMQTEPTAGGARAYLGVEDETEPYLGGVTYTALPPKERYREIQQLSGGERTIAALALLFAIHKHRPSPFFILDEIDSNLDITNASRVANYILKNKDSCQFIVISLKENLYSLGDSLVGVFRDQDNKASGILTLDLTNYPEEAPAREEGAATPDISRAVATPSSRARPTEEQEETSEQ